MLFSVIAMSEAEKAGTPIENISVGYMIGSISFSLSICAMF
jgi:hypothetical protein